MSKTLTEAINVIRNFEAVVKYQHNIDIPSILDIEGIQRYPASTSGHHHDYEGGLLIHTAEVIRLAVSIYQSAHSQLREGNSNIPAALIIAALWHDVAKTREYAIIEGAWTKTNYYSSIGHVCGSLLMLQTALTDNKIELDKALFDDISHLMLSHHGRLEWRSPVEPQNIAAYCLHFADNMSAKFSLER